MIDKFIGDYAFLSNFHPSPIGKGDCVYATTEHAYQAMKCAREEDRLAIQNLDTPGKAKRMGRKVQGYRKLV